MSVKCNQFECGGATEMSMEQELGELICMLNPYTHDMDIYVRNPDPKTIATDYKQIELEVESKYPGEWSFKGQAQRINTAGRIRYRYPVKDEAGEVLYWKDDYLLIGYEGAGP